MATFFSFPFYMVLCHNEQRRPLANSSNLALNFSATWKAANKLLFIIIYPVSIFLSHQPKHTEDNRNIIVPPYIKSNDYSGALAADSHSVSLRL